MLYLSALESILFLRKNLDRMNKIYTIHFRILSILLILSFAVSEYHD